jgi:hypothetical protein
VDPNPHSFGCFNKPGFLPFKKAFVPSYAFFSPITVPTTYLATDTGRIFLKNHRASLYYDDLSNGGMSLIYDTSRWTVPLKSIFPNHKDAKNLKTIDAYTESTH